MTARVFSILISGSILLGCNSDGERKKNEKNVNTIEQVEVKKITGDYVSIDYKKRGEGYDWVAVSIKQSNDSVIRVSIRSRADLKKPTCTFDSEAHKVNQNLYRSRIEGKSILYVFSGDSLVIKSEKKEDEKLLKYYCSGGGSIGGNYFKINENLDQKQIDKTVFTKALNWNEMGYSVTSEMKNGIHELTIIPYGLKTENRILKTQIDGKITNAEIGDLDVDGYAELLIYIAPDNKKGSNFILGYSPNNGKSLSEIYFPNTKENDQLNKGYFGNDEFAIVENTLVQRFKLFRKDGASLRKLDKTRQIQYKLIKGENSKRFVVDKILEF